MIQRQGNVVAASSRTRKQKRKKLRSPYLKKLAGLLSFLFAMVSGVYICMHFSIYRVLCVCYYFKYHYKQMS